MHEQHEQHEQQERSTSTQALPKVFVTSALPLSSPPPKDTQNNRPHRNTRSMGQYTHDEPDEATAGSYSPRHDILDEKAFEAHKEVMLDMLRSNTAHMDFVTRLYRGPDPDFFFYGSLIDPDAVRFIAEISAAEPQLHLHTASIRGLSGVCGGSIRPSFPGPLGTRSRLCIGRQRTGGRLI